MPGSSSEGRLEGSGTRRGGVCPAGGGRAPGTAALAAERIWM